MEVENIIRKIRFGIDSIEATYNMTPNKLILGAEIMNQIAKEIVFTLHDHEDVSNTILGIPVEIDYKNLHRMSVCLEFDVN